MSFREPPNFWQFRSWMSRQARQQRQRVRKGSVQRNPANSLERAKRRPEAREPDVNRSVSITALTAHFREQYPATVGARWTLFLLAASLASAQTRNPFASDPREIDVGRATFRIYCSPCHGIHGQGNRGPDLTSGVYSAGKSDQELYDVIADGIPGTEMPASAPPRMTSDSIWRVVAYLRSIAQKRPAPLPGDPASGEKIFWGKGQCGSCHRAGVRGGRTGPDLSSAGRSRTLAFLRESIVSPDSQITPGYTAVTVVTRDGGKISGAGRNVDNFSVQLMDARENLHTFLRSEVQSVQKEKRSLMPEGYGKALSSAELDDLLSYLAGLGREETR